jgi:hypothetical protein
MAIDLNFFWGKSLTDGGPSFELQPTPARQSTAVSRAEFEALRIMVLLLFKLTADGQGNPVAWLENARATLIQSIGSEDEALLQGVRAEIDLRLSEVASWRAARQ